jgi:hypothetical protein
MPTGSLLLRVFLSLCLILNGVASAAASAQMPMSMSPSMPMSPHETATTPPSITAADAMPCHGHHATAQQPAPASEAPAPAQPKHAPDCCKSGTCRCACVHIAQLGVPALQWPAAAPEHARSVRTLALGHAAPALPHPIRPPIG